MDMVLTARVLNLGWGVFPSLRLIHLIPGARLQFSYLLKLTEGISASGVLLDLVHRDKRPANSAAVETVLQFARAFRNGGWTEVRFEMARFAGHRRAVRLYSELTSALDVPAS